MHLFMAIFGSLLMFYCAAVLAASLFNNKYEKLNESFDKSDKDQKFL